MPALPTLVVLLSGLYFSQGLPFGFFTQALPVMMRQEGVDLAAIGLANLLAIPWALKFLWAPWIDRVAGPRRRVILPLQFAAIGLLLVLALGGSLPIGVMVAAVLLTNTIAATQDIATDGLAVEVLPAGHRGLGNSIQVAGYRLGMVVGGGGLLIAYDRLGPAGTMGTAAALLVLASLPLWFFVQPDPGPRTPPARNASLFHVWAARPGAWGWILLLVAFKFGDAFGTGMVKPFLVDLQYGLSDVGWMLGIMGSTLGLVGALVGGAAVMRMGRRRALLSFAAIQVVTMGIYVLVAMQFPSFAWVAVAAEHIVSGMATVSLFTAMMDMCRPGHAGTDYTVQASIVVIAQGVAAASSGFAARALGWPAFFALSALLCLGAVVVVARHRADTPFGLA